MIPPIYVKAYVKRGKTDAADAEAICEAVTRPTMRFVRSKASTSRRQACCFARAACSFDSARSSPTLSAHR